MGKILLIYINIFTSKNKRGKHIAEGYLYPLPQRKKGKKYNLNR